MGTIYRSAELGDEPKGPNADLAFVDYYSAASLSGKTLQRFFEVQRKILALRTRLGLATSALKVADIGCGAGTQAINWAAAGHEVCAIDISQPLVKLGQQRAAEAGVLVSFSVGSASELPYPDASFDIVLLPELLEHVPEWQPCLKEAARVLRPGGMLYISTTNVLCPRQNEFSLPLYSWYPRWLKKQCERMAVTTHKHWVEHASFPAVHWFSFYQLRAFLADRGIDCLDRFDLVEVDSSPLKRGVIAAIRNVPTLRFIAHVATPSTVVLGIKPAI